MVQSIRLQHFRSYTDDSFEFSPSVNIIVGPNASGKTNLLEAMLVMALGSSYRAHDADLVAFKQSWARLDGIVDEYQRTIKLVNEPKPEKIFELSGRTIKRLSLEDTLPVVLFEPNDLSLITGQPERRRDYLDTLLTQTIPSYGSTLRSYRRALAQRNRLLKSPHIDADQLFPWNVRLSELSGTIVRARSQLIQAINEKINQLYQDLSHANTRVSVAYNLSGEPQQYESHMLHQLEVRLVKDRMIGFTSFGPHREDFEILFDGHPAEETASRGETRTFVLGLKLIELELLREKRNKVPMLLLDDVFSELDGARRQALTNHLQPYQSLITTTDADVVLKHFSEKSNILLVSKNKPNS
jgi:DNA replication and repair protein RecF